MRQFERPKVVISKCLGFEHCRYDGSIIESPLVTKLKDFVDFIPVCPEVEIGLGVPRRPIHIVLLKEGMHLIQSETEKDVTADLVSFAETFLNIRDVAGFILKAKSPSCGVGDAKIYVPQSKKVAQKGNGLFAQQIINKYGYLAIESERRLENRAIYEHFLSKIFATADFWAAKHTLSMKKLIDFHTRYKLFLMAHHQSATKELGKIVANPHGKDTETVFAEYEVHFFRALRRAMNRRLAINVFYHVLGYFKDKLAHSEKGLFMNLLEGFRRGTVAFPVLVNIVRVWIARFNEPYLAQQVFFSPYPLELSPQEIYDTIPESDYWNRLFPEER
ncbi:MAG: hypothetical protein PWP60_1062 [Candidatus Atribacteria bacterium]|uniref:DUF523 and DUF1722 domain-containing protein n=1 Tax=Thermatribacter velox TaxID=3039681 RepID=A0ABZ2YAT8_9BACT|nr:hypothetical protein [Candidatus Atribacteria bacterium]MDI3531213.1 hypothetical protein [Candidatus Atribacteria bacterium]